MKKAAKRKCLADNHLEQWAGLELNQRHTDFQSFARAISPYLARCYRREFEVFRGIQVVNKWNYKWLTRDD